MAITGKSIVSIEDLSNQDIEDIFDLADTLIRRGVQTYHELARGRVLAALFFEPSTRTRFSFESAIARLGGNAITAWDMAATSLTKGETLADTIRVVSGYADIIALRHPWDGAAKLAAMYSDVPVVNAGDGGHEHPTQTLCDLYTLRQRHGSLKDLTVALCGDLEKGRTIHSLAFALARFGAHVIFVPGNGKEIPDHVLNQLRTKHGGVIKRVQVPILSALFGRSPGDELDTRIDAIYMTPTSAHQLTWLTDAGTTLRESESRLELRIADKSDDELKFDVFYVTRLQKERSDEQAVPPDDTDYPHVTTDTLKVPQYKNISILHPLPRVGEISPEVDKDHRSLYFKQAAYGVPIRMALMMKILGLAEIEDERYVESPPADQRWPIVQPKLGVGCSNSGCVTNHEPQSAPRTFLMITDPEVLLRCSYCDYEISPRVVGIVPSHKYYPANSYDVGSVQLANLVFFKDASSAKNAGFTPGRPRPQKKRSTEFHTVEARSG